MMTLTNKLIRLGIIIGVSFIFFLGINKVKANTFSDVLVGYGYSLYENGTTGSRSWVAYNSNNLVNYGYNLGSTRYYEIDEFNIRFRPSGGFQRGSSYNITFKWYNGHPNDDITNFYPDWLLMTHNLLCYSSSWSSSSQSGSNCFTSSNVYATDISSTEPDTILVTITLVPSADFYGLALVNQHGSTFTYYKSAGWEITDIAYSYSTDGSQDIINNANQNTQNIINNQDSNTQDIIDNQNQNTQAIIDSSKTCKKIGSNYKYSNGYLNISGNVVSNTQWFYTQYIDLYPSSTIQVILTTETAQPSYCFYNSSKTLISCARTNTLNSYLTIPSGSSYVRFSIINASLLPTYQICTSSGQAIQDALTDTTSPDTSSLSNATGWLPPGPVDSILNLPLTILQALTNAFSSNSCQPLVIRFPHISRDIPIPCMSTIWENFGLLPLFTWIGRVIGGILLYKYLINLYKWVDDTLTMRENNNFDDGSLG